MSAAEIRRAQILSDLERGLQRAKPQDRFPVGNQYCDVLVLVEASQSKVGDNADRLVSEAMERVVGSLKPVRDAHAAKLAQFDAGQLEVAPPPLDKVLVPNLRSDLLLLVGVAKGAA